jgi:cardiolipin synthase
MLWELLKYGVRCYYKSGPFDHSKVLIVDELYVLLGSANLDPRSLRLNFELNVEVYDHVLAEQLSEEFERMRDRSEEITIDHVVGRPWLVRLRNSIAKLASPYL